MGRTDSNQVLPKYKYTIGKWAKRRNEEVLENQTKPSLNKRNAKQNHTEMPFFTFWIEKEKLVTVQVAIARVLLYKPQQEQLGNVCSQGHS